MAIPVQQFTPETFAQANPFLTGASAAQGLITQGIQNSYLAPMLGAQLKNYQLNNQILQPQAQYAPQLTQAKLAYAQAQAPYLQAQTQDVLQGQLPLQQAQTAGVYQGQIPEEQAQAGYVGTEAAKNRFLLNNPGLMLPGLPGQIAGIQTLQKIDPSAFQQSPAQGNGTQGNSQQSTNGGMFPINANQGLTPGGLQGLMMAGITAPIQEKLAQANYYNQRGQGYNFSLLPPDQKNSLVAQAAGLGISPVDAVNQFTQGATVQQMARNQGLDPNNMPDPIYPTNNASLTQIQRRSQALSEINKLEPLITNAMAPYSSRFDGYSPKQIGQALTGQAPDAQAQYLAAQALQPEMASLRLKAMGGQVGIEAIREVQEASMANVKSFQSLVSPAVYKQAQQYMTNWISQGLGAANNAAWKPQAVSQMTSQAQGGNVSGSSSQKVMVTNPQGVQGMISAANLQNALQQGYTVSQ